MTTPDPRQRAAALQLHGLLAHWSECANQAWLNPLLDWEETERARRSLERRLRCAHIGRFKPLADFDWAWPEQCDQRAIAELMSLDFLGSATNAILIGSSGLGKPKSGSYPVIASRSGGCHGGNGQVIFATT
ncbi:MAG: ATP-binding protein [Azonexus sp.]|uniref:ATP-binding protein n=1 Tax=Hydrogenophaga sp. TaxID=1904254 RepID=UPI00275D0CC4|nr:ATP-binding protein [Hydrogenophaga sp.]MDP3635837.1 ATP-binding protein [Azonexus sp.]MDZ4283395.1 ATP-binding protein [Hydrogenophaga sp.]